MNRLRRRLICMATTAVTIAAASVLAEPVTAGAASSADCSATQPQTFAFDQPSGSTLPVWSSATLTVSGTVQRLTTDQTVRFSVLCGPDAGHSGVGTVSTDPTSISTVPRASFKITNRGAIGTDIVQATYGSGSAARGPIRMAVTWAPPTDCGKPVARLGYLLALQCTVKAHQRMIGMVLEAGECAAGVVSLFFPELKAAQLAGRLKNVLTYLKSAAKAPSAEYLAKKFATGGPFATLLLDLYRYRQAGKIKDFAAMFEDVVDIASFLKKVNDFTSGISGADRAEITKDIALLAIDITGVGPCVDLVVDTIALANGTPKIITTTLPNATVGTAYKTLLTTADHRTGTWTVGRLAAGLTLHGYTISGIPTTAGTYRLPLTFTDGAKHKTSATATLTVKSNHRNTWPTGNDEGPPVLYAYFGAEFESAQWVSCLADQSYCIAALEDDYVHVIRMDGLDDVTRVPVQTGDPFGELTGIGFSDAQADYLLTAR